MALLKCGDCGIDISDAAPACPRCGRPQHFTPNNLRGGQGVTRIPLIEERQLLKIHPSFLFGRPLLLIIFFFMCANPNPQGRAGGITFLIIYFLICRSTTLIISNTRTTLLSQFLFTKSTEVRHEDIRNIQVSQGPFQRIFGSGRIAISSAARNEVEIKIGALARISKVKKLVDEMRDTAMTR